MLLLAKHTPNECAFSTHICLTWETYCVVHSCSGSCIFFILIFSEGFSYLHLMLTGLDALYHRGGGVPQLLGRNPGKVCGPHSLKQNNRAAAKTKCARPSASPSLEQRSPDSSEARLCVPCAARFSTGGAGDAYFAETGGGRGTPCRDEEGAVSWRHSPRRSPLGMLCTISSGQFTGVTGLRV